MDGFEEVEDVDPGDFWRKIREASQKKRWENDRRSIEFLESKGFEVKVLDKSISHYRIGDYDFWATTGKFINRKTKAKGRGVFNLYRRLSF